MIKVVIVDDERIIGSVHENPDEGMRMAWAQEGPENRGYGLFNESGELLYIVDKDNIFELIVRAALNHLDLNGVETAYTENEALFPGLYLLGFKKRDNRLEINIKDFFSVKTCGCK